MEEVIVAIADRDGAALLGGATACVRGLREGRPGEWSGYVFAPADARLRIGGRYRLSTPDGRSGDFVVTGEVESGWPGEKIIVFQGAGRFN